jgi:hypothetical protein
MPWFWLPALIGFGLVLVSFFPYSKTISVAMQACGFLLVSLVGGLVLFCIDIPARDTRNQITEGTCIECKIRAQNQFYAIGCDGHEYQINMSAWALLNTEECK